MDSCRRWLAHSILFGSLWLTALVGLACLPAEVASQNEHVSVTTDRLSYQVGDVIQVTIENRGSRPIFGWTGGTYCTILLVQAWDGDQWGATAGECQLEVRSLPVEIAAGTVLSLALAPNQDDDAPLPSGEKRIAFAYNIGSEDGPRAQAHSEVFLVTPDPASATAPLLSTGAPSVTSVAPATSEEIRETATAPPTVTPAIAPTTAAGRSEPVETGVSISTDKSAYGVREPILATVFNNSPGPIQGSTGWTYCTIIAVEINVGDRWNLAPGECLYDGPRTPIVIEAYTQYEVSLTPQAAYDPTLQAGEYRLRFTYGDVSGSEETIYSQPFTIGHLGTQPPTERLYLGPFLGSSRGAAPTQL